MYNHITKSLVILGLISYRFQSFPQNVRLSARDVNLKKNKRVHNWNPSIQILDKANNLDVLKNSRFP